MLHKYMKLIKKVFVARLSVGAPRHTSETPPMNLAFVFPPIYISVKQEAMAG